MLFAVVGHFPTPETDGSELSGKTFAFLRRYALLFALCRLSLNIFMVGAYTAS